MAALPPNWGNPFASSAAPPPSGGSSSSNGRAPGLGRDAPVPAEMSPAVAFGAPQTQAHADATAHDLVPNYAAAYPYIAREADEVELNKGDLVCVTEVGPDGWYVGTNITTGMAGTFPGNFVVQLDTAPEGDEALARRLQAEEQNASAASARSSASQSLTEDELYARRLQEEEDRRMAMREQERLGTQPPVSQPGGRRRSTPEVAAGSGLASGAAPDHEAFELKFLGSIEVGHTTGSPTIIAAIRQVQAARKRQKVSTYKQFEMQISPRGVRLVETGMIQKKSMLRRSSKTLPPQRAVSSNFPIRNVAHCAYDPTDHRMFGFVSRDKQSESSACHVFQYDKSTAPIANAFGRAFKEAQRETKRFLALKEQRQAGQPGQQRTQPETHDRAQQQRPGQQQGRGSAATTPALGNGLSSY